MTSSVPFRALSASRSHVPRLPLAIASGSMAVVSVGLFYGLTSTAPKTTRYEGRIQIRLAQPSEAAVADGFTASEAINLPLVMGTGGSTPERFAPESIAQAAYPTRSQAEQPDMSAQAAFLSSRAAITPILERLAEKNISITYKEFSQHFSVQPVEGQTLEIIYQGQRSQTVALVLEAIAQAYVKQGQSCQAQICQTFDYVKIQMRQTAQHIHQLQSKLADLEHQQGGSTQQQSQQQSLSHSVHTLTRELRSIHEQRIQLYQELQSLQESMGLPIGHQAASDLLERSPRYASLLNQWAQTDRQWVEARFFSDATSLEQTPSLDAAEQQHQALGDQLNQHVRDLARHSGLDDLPGDLRAAIVQNPSGFEVLEPWLLRATRLQLLQTRQHHLTDARDRLQPQLQRHQAFQQQRERLHRHIDTAKETFARYHQQYVILYPQVIPRQKNWQLVAPLNVSEADSSFTLL